MSYADFYASNLNQLPEQAHWVIFKQSGVSVPGDERSRRNPGHGYGAHTVNYLEYAGYLTEEKWVEEIRRLESEDRRRNYKAFKVTPANVRVNVEVEVD